LLPALGELVFAVFRGWPYLYGGGRAEARRYLASYADGSSPGAAAVVALDGDRPVGAATCQPMAGASPGVPAAFAARGLDPARFCYFGEAVLLAPYRGRGAGARFFEERERHARGLGLDFAVLCAVRRDPADRFCQRSRQTDGAELEDEFRLRGFEDCERSSGTTEVKQRRRSAGTCWLWRVRGRRKSRSSS
jgi:GNAT superfamily N-acetyltransferase